MLATPLIIYCTSVMSFAVWLLIFLACHWIAETRDWLRPGGPTCLRPNPTPHTHEDTLGWRDANKRSCPLSPLLHFTRVVMGC
uniref:Secreted protein n=1 Tax=Mesocestoides corti TaxID=53468 RepID=A0A5K3FJJ6_MESCO